ncbi:MAG: RNA 2',3'-cyclic phosphodiesterase [Thermocladium sp.]
MRLFIAVDIDNPEILDKLKKFQNALKNSEADLKIVELSNLHVTLRFIGEVRDALAPQIANKLSQLSGNSFRMHLVGVGAFPNLDYPRVVWVGISEGSNEAALFHDSIEELIKDLVGRDKDEGFSPHITMARVRSGRNRTKLIQVINQWQNMDFGWQDIKSIKLKKSTLTPQGPIYEDISEVNLL